MDEIHHEKELKMRGAPQNEVAKNPYARKLQQKEQQKAPSDTSNSHPHESHAHNAVEAALEHGKEEAHDLDHHEEKAHKVAIITGASSGIGKAVAIHLASSNYNVVLMARKKEELHKVEQELAKYNVKTLVRECDVTKVVQVHDSIQHAIKLFGRIDVLVNCAGYGMYGDFETMRLEDINGQMVTNYFGTVLCIKEALPKLKENKGVIINIASMAGLIGVSKMAAYSASKHAIVGLSESLRFELSDTGVSVSCICPGKVKTNFFNNESFKGVAYAEDDTNGIVPSAVARAVDNAIHERKALYTVPASKKWKLLLGRLLPNSVVQRETKKAMKQE